MTFASSFAAPVWNTADLFATPKSWPAEGFTNEGLAACFFEGVPFHGKPTKVFAWYGMPSNAGKGPTAAMVLIHGGGGTAFAEWVQLWNRRGYAAIAMDTTGCTPQGSTSSAKRVKHDAPGPDGWGGFNQTNEAMEDQWPYHAVAAAVRAHSLLRSLPGVDTNRVGVTGISWGGYLTCMVSGVDSRFKCAIPVYGCGFYGDDSAWAGTLKAMGAQGALWISRFDASQHLPRAAMPMLWVTGPVDHFFPMPSLQKSYRSPTGPRTLCIRPGMTHSHGAGWAPAEIAAFTESLFSGGTPLAQITGQGSDAQNAWVTWKGKAPMASAELVWTADGGIWEHRWWNTSPATFDEKSGKASAALPPEAGVFYINLMDRRGLVVSSEHIERAPLATNASRHRVLVDENYEGRGKDWVPPGVVGADPAKGAGIFVSEEVSAGGSASLAFRDAPGLAKAWEPLREFKFSGPRAITNGMVTLSFLHMNRAVKPANLTVEFRDNREKKSQTGPLVRLQADGKLYAGDKALLDLKPGTWTKITMAFDPTASTRQYRLEVTPQGAALQSFSLPFQSGEFRAVHWLGFILYNDDDAGCFFDDLRLETDAP